MIITLTLNPAVDKTIEIDDFKVNSVNRVSSTRLDCGGKGINVSKVLQALESKSKAVVVLAGESGKYIKEQLDNLNIENDTVLIGGETRTNIKIVDKVKNTNTDINEKGPDISMADLAKVESILLDNLDEKSVLVISGSVPGSLDNDVYKNIILKVKSKGVKTLLDADGELLKKSIEGGPFLVKPNIHELERFFGLKMNTIDEVIKTAKMIFQYGVEIVVVSLGAEGSVVLTNDKTIVVEALKVDVKSTVGAGDAMVAAWAMSIEREYSLEKAAVLAAAASAASVTTFGTVPGDIEIVKELEKRVKFYLV